MTMPPSTELAATASHAVREILAEAASANTVRSYSTALRYWAAWHEIRIGQRFALPLTADAVTQFIVDHVERTRPDGSLAFELPAAVDAALVEAGFKRSRGALKLATVVHRVAALSKAHQLAKKPNPCEHPEVRHLLSRARRAAHKRGERPNKKTAIARRDLEAMLATCDETPEGLRDRALLYFAFASGGRRRSEVAAADMRDLRREGDRSFVYRLSHSKTQQSGPKRDSSPDKPLVGAAADALARWLELAGITEGRIFRTVWNSTIGQSLTGETVAEIVRRRAVAAGLSGDFAGHSLRSGFVTESGRQGVSLPAVMAMTEHRSVQSVVGYYQTGSATENPAARLLED
ncbi:site-specific integrase [Lysobacter sp. HA18]